MDITHITSLLGGIALFLYGMSIMGAGLEKLAGGKMQGVLQKLTSSTLKAVIFGTLITGVIQSSAGTVVICVGLVNSGIMTLTQSVGVIMGANIGTTVTGQLIRMADISGDSLWLTLIQPKTFAPVVAFVGCIFYVFIRNAKKKAMEQYNAENTTEETAEKEAPETAPADTAAFNLTRLYRFRDLDTVIRAAHILEGHYNGENSLYKDPLTREYHLIISKSGHTPEEFNKICNILSEYAGNRKYVPTMRAFYQEHMEIIVKDEALQKLAQLA